MGSLIYLLAKEEGKKWGRCMSTLFFFAAFSRVLLARVGFHVGFVVYLLAWSSLDFFGRLGAGIWIWRIACFSFRRKAHELGRRKVASRLIACSPHINISFSRGQQCGRRSGRLELLERSQKGPGFWFNKTRND